MNSALNSCDVCINVRTVVSIRIISRSLEFGLEQLNALECDDLIPVHRLFGRVKVHILANSL